ncbi:plant UBX domain-containing protein 8-like [Salvia miltiorrhiza]|uniref:plant UBX domain-containing protein 8-like n=1 Tax=Salvia miltiorrhiza TaxID=226208 RepID=UPI0025ABEC7D|nr:plant UBX domain-containing protein 8-like [Salvia miltiorrhiza]
MARPDQEAIDTFISITGVSEAAAVRKLEEHHGSLNEAVNAHFTEGDRNIVQEASFGVPGDNIMDIDDPIQVEPPRPHSSLPPFARDVNHSSSIEPNFRTSLIDSVTGIAPDKVKDGTGTSAQSGSAPNDGDDDDENIPNLGRITDIEGHAIRSSSDQHGPTAPTVIDVPDDSYDIEEEMIQAAIEASRQDAAMPNQQYDHLDPGDPIQSVQSNREDAEISHAVSLSLQTAEKDEVLEELEGQVGASQQETQKSSSDEMGRITSSDGRLPRLEIGSTSVQYENEDVEERQLVRHRRRRMTSSSTDATIDAEGAEVNPPSSRPPNNNAHHSEEQNGGVFPSDEWGGISSVEHDEAVMLEAAMFGGVPEGIGYHFPHAPHRMMQNGLHGDVGPNPWSIPRPPSPSLTAQRLIREQQDDEYLAALQADREKELKAKEEAEAALAEEIRKDDELRRQLQEEEEIKRQLAAKEAALPKEPTPDDENAITLLVRMPDGSRRGRRFQKSDKLQYLLDFIDVGRGVKPGSYRLVRPYPRRAFSDGESSSTLSELGLTSKQEALYLELI